MKNYKRKKETTKADNETLLLEQIKNLTALIKELKSTPLQDSGNREKKSEIKGNLKFSKKEITEMPRLKDFKIRVKNNRYYEIRFRRYGYNVSFSSTNFEVAKRKAFEWLNTFEGEIKANVNFAVVKKGEENIFYENKNVMFTSFAHNYLYNVKKPMVVQYTFDNIINIYKNHVAKIYDKYPVSKIKPEIIQKHLNVLSKEKGRTCETVRSILNGIFEYAVASDVIDRNPMKAVFIKKHERTTGTALSKDEERNFVESIKGTKHEAIFLKMLYSGVRPCEINDIKEDFGNNTITIKNGKLKSYQKNLFRIIPIFPLYKQVAECDCGKLNPRKLSYEFREYCPNHQLKDLRHTFTTRARECGIDNELVAVWTGHSLGNITSSVYTHFSIEFQQEQAKKLIYN